MNFDCFIEPTGMAWPGRSPGACLVCTRRSLRTSWRIGSWTNRTRLMPTSAATVALNHDAATTTPLLVRGNNRAPGDFFGNVISAPHVPLRAAWGNGFMSRAPRNDVTRGSDFVSALTRLGGEGRNRKGFPTFETAPKPCGSSYLSHGCTGNIVAEIWRGNQANFSLKMRTTSNQPEHRWCPFWCPKLRPMGTGRKPTVAFNFNFPTPRPAAVRWSARFTRAARLTLRRKPRSLGTDSKVKRRRAHRRRPGREGSYHEPSARGSEAASDALTFLLLPLIPIVWIGETLWAMLRYVLDRGKQRIRTRRPR